MEAITHTTTKLQFDRQTLVEIYERLSPALYRYAYRLLGDADQAEECVAETFSRFLQALSNGRTPDNVQAYLYRVAHNWITDQYRRQPVLEELDPEKHEAMLGSHQENPAHTVAENFEQERIRKALRLLSPEQRQVVVLRFLEERSHEEVAIVLGKTVEATRALQHRAIESLRRLLIAQEEQ